MAGYGLGRGSGGGYRRDGSGGGGGCGGAGCFSIIAIIVILSFIMALFSTFSSCTSTSFSTDISASTVEREPLPAGAAESTRVHFQDLDGGWIFDDDVLERGMESFKDETGVEPYLVILPNGTSTSQSELSRYAQQTYDELFDDEGHFLLVFCDDGSGGYTCGYAIGAQAKTIMDDEALDIFADYLDRYYYDYDLSEEEIFADTFADTGKRIMSKTTSPVVYVAICAAVVIVAMLVFTGVKKYRQSKEREAERMQEVLNTPLETFGDADLEDLEKKYSDSSDADDA